MPNIWTHMIYGESLLHTTQYDSLLDDKQTAAYFRLGCQGPDFFFYHRFWPWHREKPLEALGNALHQQHCGHFLLDVLDLAVQNGASPCVRAYLTGFVTHHLLDRNLHPYIHCKSGYAKWDHQRFEVILDTRMVEQHRSFHSWNTAVWKQIDVGNTLDPDITSLLVNASRTWYKQEAIQLTADDINNAYRDMLRALKLFYDPYGWKRLLTLGQINPFVYKKRVPERDYLNEQRQPWRHPANPNEIHHESIFDLWQIALDEGLGLIDLTLNYLQAPAHSLGQTQYASMRSELAARLDNISYDTGKACDSPFVNTHAEPIW